MNLLVLTYHYFHREKPSGIIKEDFPFSVRLDDFERHCSELSSSGYRILDPEKITDPDQYREESNRQVLMTIDDGHQSVDEGVEILLKYKLRPVLNVIPGMVGNDNYMTWSSLRDLAIKGFSIQSHSMNHRDLTRLSPRELTIDLEKSKKMIEDNIGLPVIMLAAPMGRINRRVAGTAHELGFRVIMTSFTGINRNRDDLKYLKRFQIKRNRHSLQLDRYFAALSGVRISGAAKNLAKKIRDCLL